MLIIKFIFQKKKKKKKNASKNNVCALLETY
jgi:hypothetical protein